LLHLSLPVPQTVVGPCVECSITSGCCPCPLHASLMYCKWMGTCMGLLLALGSCTLETPPPSRGLVPTPSPPLGEARDVIWVPFPWGVGGNHGAPGGRFKGSGGYSSATPGFRPIMRGASPGGSRNSCMHAGSRHGRGLPCHRQLRPPSPYWRRQHPAVASAIGPAVQVPVDTAAGEGTP
jgi:hypothetical protein